MVMQPHEQWLADLHQQHQQDLQRSTTPDMKQESNQNCEQRHHEYSANGQDQVHGRQGYDAEGQNQERVYPECPPAPKKHYRAKTSGSTANFAQHMQVQHHEPHLMSLITHLFSDGPPLSNVRVNERNYTTTSVTQNKRSTTHRVTVTNSVTYSINKPGKVVKPTRSIQAAPRSNHAATMVRRANGLERYLQTTGLSRVEEVEDKEEAEEEDEEDE